MCARAREALVLARMCAFRGRSRRGIECQPGHVMQQTDGLPERRDRLGHLAHVVARERRVKAHLQPQQHKHSHAIRMPPGTIR
jgi:hypothetical protein